MVVFELTFHQNTYEYLANKLHIYNILATVLQGSTEQEISAPSQCPDDVMIINLSTKVMAIPNSSSDV